MKITKKQIRKFHDKIEKIVDDIQELALECNMEEGETDLAKILWIAQEFCEDACQTLESI